MTCYKHCKFLGSISIVERQKQQETNTLNLQGKMIPHLEQKLFPTYVSISL